MPRAFHGQIKKLPWSDPNAVTVDRISGRFCTFDHNESKSMLH